MNSLHDAMCRSIEDCEQIFDDLERIADPVAKLRAYARIAQNREPERQASDIRLRAERGLNRVLEQMTYGEAGKPKRARRRGSKS